MTENDQSTRPPEPGQAQGAAPPPAPARPTLQRSRSDRKVAGVAGGLGRYFDIDPLIFRIVFVVLAVFGGSGLLLYAIGWLLIPDEGEQESDAQQLVNGRVTPRIILAIVLGLVGLAALGNFLNTGFGFGGLAALVAIGVAALLISRSQQPGGPGARPQAPYAPMGPSAPGAFGQTPGTAYTGAPVGAAVGYPPPGTPYGPVPPPYQPPQQPPQPPPPPPKPPGSPLPVPPPAPPRERSPLGRITVSVALLVAGLLVALDAATSVDIEPEVVLAAALAVVGVGLVVGAVAGRARGLIAIGIVLVVATTVTALVHDELRGGTGDRVWAPTSASQVDSPYRLGAGEARLDLTALDLVEGDSLHVDASLGAGQLLVIVPQDVDLDVAAHAGIGSITMPDGTGPSGLDVNRDYTTNTAAPAGTMQLDLEVGVGDLEVRRASS